MKKSVIILSVLMLIFSQLNAQLIIKGEFRPRFEYRTGYKNLNAQDVNALYLVTQRTRLTFNYTTGIFSFGLGIQDARIWGDEKLYNSTGVFGDDASLDLNEAWIGMNIFKNASLKIGRQYWIYEDERLLAERNWNQSSIKYDGVLFKYFINNYQFDLGLSWSTFTESYISTDIPVDKIKTQNFLYLKKKFNEVISASVLGMATGFSDTTNASEKLYVKGTAGAIVDIKKGGFKLFASGYYQFGRNRFGKEVSAYLANVKTSYTFNNKFLVGVGCDYISGNNAKDQDDAYLEKDHLFDLFYGMRHRFQGHMDLFQDIPKSTAGGGIVDFFLNLKYQFHPKVNVYMDWHYFSLQNNVVDKTYEGTGVRYLSKALGPEMDLGASWDITSFLNIQGGYSFMIPTSSMEIIQKLEPGDSKFPNWAWVMITAKPVFLDTSNK